MSLSPEQMEIRRLRVGGSEVGALLGVDKFKGVLELFADRTLAPVQQTGEHLAWGTELEPLILRSYARRAGWTLLGCPGTLTDARFPSLCVTPDDLALVPGVPGPVPLDAKNVQEHNAHEWGKPGTAEVPLMYAAQIQVQIALCAQLGGADHGYLIASLGGAPPEAWRIDYDPEVFGAISNLADKFIVEHVLPRIPPEGWERDKSALEFVKRRWIASVTEDLREPVAADLAALADYRRALEMEAAAEAEKKRASAVLGARIGDARGIARVARWTDVAPGTAAVTDWQGVAQEMAVAHQVPIEEQKALVARWTQEKVFRAGYRKLYVKPEKKKQLESPTQKQLPARPVEEY